MKQSVLILLLSFLLVFSKADDEPTPFEYVVLSLSRIAIAFVEDLLSTHTPTPIDAFKTPLEIIMSNGYQAEIHKVKAEDGYINTAYRITGILGSKETLTAHKRPPVIFQHGLHDDSTSYFVNEKESVIPFQLVEEGYDVWLTNVRGNIYSYEHMDIQTHDSKIGNSDYFKFTYDDMAKYDLPSYLDYILDRSEYKKALYVGHSQGTTIFFAAADITPKLEDKIAAFIGFGPVMYLGNVGNPFITSIANLPLPEVLKFFQKYNFGVKPNNVDRFSRSSSTYLRKTNARFFQLMFGIDKDIHLNLDRIPVLSTFFNGGTSLFNMIHWLQGIRSGEFKMYDYGTPEENIEHYGQDTPPLYDTDKIQKTLSKIPSLLLLGTADGFVRPKDFEKLMNVLKGAPVEVVNIKGYNHFDYYNSVDSKEKVVTPVIDFIKKNTKKV